MLEPLRGYLMLAERLADDPARWSGPWNFGPSDSDARPVAWLAGEIAGRWGDGASWRAETGDSVYEAKLLSVDIAKAETVLARRPASALARATEWAAVLGDFARIQTLGAQNWLNVRETIDLERIDANAPRRSYVR